MANYLILTCDEDGQVERLRGRYPRTLKNLPSDENITGALNGNRIITPGGYEHDTATVLETTHHTIDQTLAQAERWITDRL